MKMTTRNFGEIEFAEENIIHFEEGIPGFRSLKEYVLIGDNESAFEYMQSVTDGNISFVLINPYVLVKDYTINIKDTYVEALGGGTSEKFSVYVTVTIVGDIENATVNLVAPILIQNETKKGMQIILENSKYTTKHGIMELIKEGGC